MSSIHVRPAPLLALGALALTSLVLVAWVRFTAPTEAIAPALEQAKRFTQFEDLWFSAQSDGSLLIERADGRPVVQIASGEGGFIRATLRSLGGPVDSGAQHFQLALSDQGQLLLIHAASGRVLDLKAYGPSNRQAFFQILLASESTP